MSISSRTIDRLRQLQSESIRTAVEDFVFSYDDGSHMGEIWWRKRKLSTQIAGRRTLVHFSTIKNLHIGETAGGLTEQ